MEIGAIGLEIIQLVTYYPISLSPYLLISSLLINNSLFHNETHLFHCLNVV